MDILSIFNTIRDNASEQYQNRIPEGTQQNIESVQAAMMDPTAAFAANEFMSSLLNMIARQVIHIRMFENPLKMLKKGNKPLGDTVEEIYTNFIKAKVYDQTGAALLNRNLPDTKTVWHRMNRQDMYKITVNYEALWKAFTSWEKLDTYVASIINTCYNSAELDEFVLMKELIKQAIDNNAMVVYPAPDPLTSESNGKAFIKAVKTVSGNMVFPSEDYNAYLTAQSADEVPITTLSRKSEQILILTNETEVSVNVDVLASVFNMSVAEFNETRKITIDNFPDPSIRAALVDEAFFQVYDDMLYFTNFRNPEGLYDNYYLHVWQTMAYSPLVNAVAFMVASDIDEDGAIETYSVSYSLPAGVKSSNKRKSVTEGGKFKTTLTGITSETVTVTVGGSTDSEAYDAETGVVEIDGVSGDVVITVA